jgi:hypothetical protein
LEKPIGFLPVGFSIFPGLGGFVACPPDGGH